MKNRRSAQLTPVGPVIVDECYRLWVLKKSRNRAPFHLRACPRRCSCLGSTKWWLTEPALSAD